MFYPLSSNSWGDEEALVFKQTLEKGRFTMGESVKEFESSLQIKLVFKMHSWSALDLWQTL